MMDNDVINPIPAIMIHNLVIISISLFFLRRRFPVYAAIGLSFLVALGLSLFWKKFDFAFDRVWLHLLHDPVFDLRIFYNANNDDYLGIMLFWILPLILAGIAVRVQKRIWESKKSLSAMRNEQKG